MARISRPVRPGIEMSRMAMSGTKLRIASMQLAPSLQHATTLKPLFAPSTFYKPCRTTGRRSAIITLLQRMGGPPPLRLIKPWALAHILLADLAGVIIFRGPRRHFFEHTWYATAQAKHSSQLFTRTSLRGCGRYPL